MDNLNPPSRELAERIMRNVPFEDRIIGYRLHERLGFISTALYSFSQVLHFLNYPEVRLDFLWLSNWLEQVQRDKELAEKIQEALARGQNGLQLSLLARELMRQRMNQCLELLGDKSA